MRRFGVILVVLCTLRASAALPRPDFGIGANVYGSGKVNNNAQESAALIDKVNDEVDIPLSSGYALLTTVKTQLVGIANDFATKGLAVSTALATFATSTGPLAGAFDAYKAASDELLAFLNTGLTSYYTTLNTAIGTPIADMLTDAFGDVAAELSTLSGLLDTLKQQLQAAVTAAGSSNPSQTILRKHVSTTLTSRISIAVQSLKANIPLVSYVIKNSIENLATADQFIIDAGTAASSALDEVSTGLEDLENEVERYSNDLSQVTSIISPVQQANFNFGSIPVSSLSNMNQEIGWLEFVYTTRTGSAVSLGQSYYDTYKQSIPMVSDGLPTFYSTKGCAHLYRLVLVLVANGEHAEYCYEKYYPKTLASYDQHVRSVNQCVDQEFTRLIKLHEVVLRIAQQAVFNIEELLSQMTLCYSMPTACEQSIVATVLHNLHVNANYGTFQKMEDLIKFETIAGLNRLKACVSTSKTKMLNDISTMISGINECESEGPDD